MLLVCPQVLSWRDMAPRTVVAFLKSMREVGSI